MPETSKPSNDPQKSDSDNVGKVESFLSHSGGRKKKEPEKDERTLPEALPVPPKSESQAALSEKMAKISSIRVSAGPLDPSALIADNRAASTLPQAMARLHRLKQEKALREKLSDSTTKQKKLVRKPIEFIQMSMDDPDPGFLKTTTWFIFSFGRFAKSVLLAQSLKLSLLFCLIVGLGSIHTSIGFLSPLPSPEQLYDVNFASRVIAGGMILGLAVYLLLSIILFLTAGKIFGGIGKMFGLKVVVNAFLPLAVVQLIAMGFGTMVLGEAYWRGNLPVGYGVFSGWILPGMWLWGGYRIAQVFTQLYSLSLPMRFGLKMGIPLVLSLPLLTSVSGVERLMHSGFEKEWAVLQTNVMASGGFLPIERYDQIEGRIPFRDIERKRDLYLFRMQALYRLDEQAIARADALRLDRMSTSGSADDHLAKGLNYLFQNRLDLAIPKLKLAIEVDPTCLPAHQWLALGQVSSNIGLAEEHAHILMTSEPNVFHLSLMVRILFAQEKYQEIWDVMLDVDTSPEKWDPVTLYQGGIAASKLGNLRRSATLLALAKVKGFEADAN